MECKEPTKRFIYGSKKQKKSVAMTTIVARYCRKTNRLQSVQGYGRQRTHKIIYKSKKQKKSVAMTTIVARYCRKTNQLQSVQGYGMQRTHKLFISPRNRRKVLPWQHLLPGIVEKLVSSNPFRGLECKEPTKMFIYRSKKNIKCCHENTYCRNCQESNHIQVLTPLNLHSYIYMQNVNEISHVIFSILYTILYIKK